MLQEKKQDRPYAVAFALLAVTVGVLAGGAPALMIALGATFALLYLLAERQGWLMHAAAGAVLREYIVTGVFTVLVVLFVYLTGGLRSPMPCTLYLPVLLASLCYGMRLGLISSLLMVGVAAVLAMNGHLPSSGLSSKAIAIGLSFPVVAVFGGALRTQMEGRLEALHAEKKDLNDLLDVSQMMDSAFDLDTTLNLILLNVQEHCPCRVCAVYLLRDDGRTLELRAASSLSIPVALLPSLTLEEARAEGWSVGDAVQDESHVQAFYAPTANGEGPADPSCLFALDRSARSFACFPLATVEGLLGMLYVGFAEPEGLALEKIGLLEQLMSRTVFPLQRVLRQQDFQAMAYSDAMTGLDNFRQFEETLTAELTRAERYGRPLSIILIDIDHFKSFNDTRGHQAGDALLGQLGVVLRNALRNVDHPARYGGEEFVIICPETGDLEAALIAERIRQNVADTSFVLPDKEADASTRGAVARVTVSLGCATFPHDAHAGRDLVKKADIALYAAKAAGRNTVCTYKDHEAPAAAEQSGPPARFKRGA